MVSVPARREQVALALKQGLSQRRACTLMKVGRSALGYRSRKGAKDGPVLVRMAELAALYPRYGYRRVRIFLGRDGHTMRRWPGAPSVATCEAASAKKTAKKAHCDGTFETEGGPRPQPGVELRFCFRRLRQRSAVEVLHDHGRGDEGGLGDRGRWPYSLWTRDRGSIASGIRTRRACRPALR